MSDNEAGPWIKISELTGSIKDLQSALRVAHADLRNARGNEAAALKLASQAPRARDQRRIRALRTALREAESRQKQAENKASDAQSQAASQARKRDKELDELRETIQRLRGAINELRTANTRLRKQMHGLKIAAAGLTGAMEQLKEQHKSLVNRLLEENLGLRSDVERLTKQADIYWGRLTQTSDDRPEDGG